MTQFKMFDRVTLDASSNMRKTSRGYLVANPRVARTGIQLYRGDELDRPDLETVRVYRPDSTVFEKDSMASMAFKPITNDHPTVLVDASNWKDYSVGMSGGEVARDGDYLRVPMMVNDAKAVRDIERGKKELSVGYTSDIEFTPGTSPTGEAYDAVMTGVRGNHHAIVWAGRAGKKAAFGDEAPAAVSTEDLTDAMLAIKAGNVNVGDKLVADKTDGYLTLSAEYPFGDDAGTVYLSALRDAHALATSKGDPGKHVLAAVDALLSLFDGAHNIGDMSMTTSTQTVTVDGISVNVLSVQDATIVQKALRDLQTKLDDTATLLAKAQTDAANAATTFATEKAVLTKDAETATAKIATLESQLKDAAMTPAKLDALVKDRAGVIGKAKGVLADKLVVDGKTDHEIKQQVVVAKVGDVAKAWNVEQVSASFDTLTAGVKAADGTLIITPDAGGDGLQALRDAMMAGGAGGGGGDAKTVKAYDAYETRLQKRFQSAGSSQVKV